MRKLTFLLTVVTVGSLTALARQSMASVEPSAQVGQTPSVAALQRAAARSRGLEAAANVTGSYIETVAFSSVGGPADWNELSGLSNLVAVGLVLDNLGALTRDGKSVVSRYTVRLERLLKGTSATNDIEVLLPGGRFGFPDGSWAQINVTNFSKPANGVRAVWFLREATPNERPRGLSGSAYVTAAGPLGLYSLDRTGRRAPHVLPAGGFGAPLAKKVHAARLLPDDFIRHVASRVQ